MDATNVNAAFGVSGDTDPNQFQRKGLDTTRRYDGGSCWSKGPRKPLTS